MPGQDADRRPHDRSDSARMYSHGAKAVSGGRLLRKRAVGTRSGRRRVGERVDGDAIGIDRGLLPNLAIAWSTPETPASAVIAPFAPGIRVSAIKRSVDQRERTHALWNGVFEQKVHLLTSSMDRWDGGCSRARSRADGLASIFDTSPGCTSITTACRQTALQRRLSARYSSPVHLEAPRTDRRRRRAWLPCHSCPCAATRRSRSETNVRWMVTPGCPGHKIEVRQQHGSADPVVLQEKFFEYPSTPRASAFSTNTALALGSKSLIPNPGKPRPALGWRNTSWVAKGRARRTGRPQPCNSSFAALAGTLAQSLVCRLSASRS